MTQDQATGINPYGEASQWSPNTNGLDGEGYAALRICSMLATLAGTSLSHHAALPWLCAKYPSQMIREA